jgi:hypothetical protein
MANDKRRKDRKSVSYYLPIFEKGSTKPYGILTDVSQKGFCVDARTAVPEGTVIHFRINLETDVAPKPNVEFVGRARWCRPDSYDPSTYNAGFEIIDISLIDSQVYERVINLYGTKRNMVGSNDLDYLWK